jgi:HlyD family secretion protein
MKFDLSRIFGEATPMEAPQVGGPLGAPLSAEARASIRGPIIAGGLIVLIFVVGLGLWATFAPIWGAIVAPGQIRVEANRKTLKSREGGVVRMINVRDGDLVRSGQLLMRFDDTLAAAQVQVLENQQDTFMMQRARFLAETTRQSTLIVPQALLARRSDPRVAGIIQNETFLFSSRLAAIEGQGAILNQRLSQLTTAQSGLKLQVDSIDAQTGLITEELRGYQTLYEKGYAPKTLILRLQRTLAEIGGRRGALMTDITRSQQQAGETRLQLAQLYEQRSSEAAAGVREAESRLADLAPRLHAGRESLAQTRVHAPADGYVLNLSQFTLGGVAGPGEPLLDIVPSDAPLVISARVKPGDIDQVRPGMSADISLMAYSANKVPKLSAEVITVSADALVTSQGAEFFRADLRIKPEEIRKLPKGVKLYPGMPAMAMIQTKKRTILSYLLGPMVQVMDKALREE